MKIRNVLMLLVCGMLVCTARGKTAYAAEKISSYTVPSEMTANSVIEYEGDGMWRLLKGEDLLASANAGDEDETEIPKETFSISRLRDSMEVLRNKWEASLDAGPSYVGVLPDPVVGMRVEYDNWGGAGRITVFEKGEYKEIKPTFAMVSAGAAGFPMASTFALQVGTRRPVGTYRYGKVVQMTKNKVGYTTNTIKITRTNVTGTGDMTVFTDKMGDHGNVLKSGDCATKGDIDNPSHGTRITVKNMLNGVADTFYKNDHGSLYNAVIDIWKTGVKRLGITSTNYGDIKVAAKYTYNISKK